jgi:hypothetical protein
MQSWAALSLFSLSEIKTWLKSPEATCLGLS